MKYLDYIKEGIFSPLEYPFNPHFIAHFDEINKNEIADYSAYCLYTEIDNKLNLINALLFRSDNTFLVEPNNFSDYFQKYNPQNFNDTLFLLDMYSGLVLRKMPKDIDSLLINRDYGSKTAFYGILESFLKDSNGILLWNYQLEKICGLVYRKPDDIVSLRKNLNSRKPYAWKILEDFKLDEKKTLRDFVEERMVFGFAKSPNIHGARALYELITLYGGDN